MALAAALATDAVDQGAVALLMHLLPAIVLATAVAIAWHRPLVGGLAFLATAVLYAAMTPGRLDWILTITAPLLVIGALFVCSWWARRSIAPHA